MKNGIKLSKSLKNRAIQKIKGKANKKIENQSCWLNMQIVGVPERGNQGEEIAREIIKKIPQNFQTGILNDKDPLSTQYLVMKRKPYKSRHSGI